MYLTVYDIEMIKSKNDYKRYLAADKTSLDRQNSIRSFLFDDIWRFQRTLRKLEYLTNCKVNNAYRIYALLSYRRQSIRLGFTIPINVFGPGLSIAHYGTIIVNDGANVGANCRLHACTNIGTEAGKSNDAPTIGNNCYIGPGAKIFGNISLGDNVVVGANAVVNKSFEHNDITIGGVPAKVLSNKGSQGLLIAGYRGYQQLPE